MNWGQGVDWKDGTNDRIIDWVNTRGGIATVSWHWFVPIDMDTYTEDSLPNWELVAFYNANGAEKSTSFSPAKAVITGTAENDYINTDIDKIAHALMKLQEKDIPIIFRPLHEAEGSSSLDGSGSWYWWGNDGAEAYKKLWKYLYHKLTDDYDLHNLIWEWNSYTFNTSYAWYPGDDYVDIIAYDKYNATDWSIGLTQPNESAISPIFYQLVEMYNNKKMVAMAENDTVPSLDNLIDDKAGWLYFSPWYGEYLMDTKYNNPSTLRTLYQSDYVITLDALPEYRTFLIQDINDTSISLAQSTYAYTGAEINPIITVTYNSNVLVNGSDYTVSYSNNTNLGTATITITGLGNYIGVATKTFTIAAAEISDATLSTTTATYNGKAKTPSATVTSGTTTLTQGTEIGRAHV